MCVELLLASALQVGPFWQKGPDDFQALRPFWSRQGGTTDVLWPIFTSHRDWWRFCYFTSYLKGQDDAYQFEVIPLWFNGRTREGEDYAGLFPIYGRHPHFLLMYDWQFACWPFWMRYRFPRPSDRAWVESNAVLWPVVRWRSDGSWGVWPLAGVTHQRESVHRYALWPVVTWADYEEDRDTAGAGSSWMVWPLYGRSRRTHERSDWVLPPLFSVSSVWSRRKDPAHPSGPDTLKVNCPWPIAAYERSPSRERLSVWPFYEKDTKYAFGTSQVSSRVTRFGWKLVELYDDETRVFPFWVSRKDGTYFRFWPFYEETALDGKGESTWSGTLALFPVRWVPAVDRNWARFWTLYERVKTPRHTDHSLFWGLIQWRTYPEGEKPAERKSAD